MKKEESLIYGIMTHIEKYMDGAEIQRAKQEETDVRKGSITKSHIYTVKLVMGSKPLILTYKIGEKIIEILLTDKNTGELLEYLVHNGETIHAVKKHNFTAEQIRKMLEVSKNN